MFGQMGAGSIGTVTTCVTSGRGFTPEELAARCTDKIVGVSSTADPMVRAQAEAFKSQIQSVVLHYLKQAVASEHTTLIHRFNAAGFPELVALLKEQ